jgi:hypothetical protein
MDRTTLTTDKSIIIHLLEDMLKAHPRDYHTQSHITTETKGSCMIVDSMAYRSLAGVDTVKNFKNCFGASCQSR